jgi:hypothetical protein
MTETTTWCLFTYVPQRLVYWTSFLCRYILLVIKARMLCMNWLLLCTVNRTFVNFVTSNEVWCVLYINDLQTFRLYSTWMHPHTWNLEFQDWVKSYAWMTVDFRPPRGRIVQFRFVCFKYREWWRTYSLYPEAGNDQHGTEYTVVTFEPSILVL